MRAQNELRHRGLHTSSYLLKLPNAIGKCLQPGRGATYEITITQSLRGKCAKIWYLFRHCIMLYFILNCKNYQLPLNAQWQISLASSPFPWKLGLRITWRPTFDFTGEPVGMSHPTHIPYMPLTTILRKKCLGSQSASRP